MRKPKVIVYPGTKIGLLEVGDLVQHVRNHPLFMETPPSYLAHGRLYECHCACGAVKLFSENVLQHGELKSCGCLRRTRRQKAWEKKSVDLEVKKHKKEIDLRISTVREKLHHLRSAPIHIQDQKAIDECGAELRKLYAMKARANREVAYEQEAKQATASTEKR